MPQESPPQSLVPQLRPTNFPGNSASHKSIELTASPVTCGAGLVMVLDPPMPPLIAAGKKAGNAACTSSGKLLFASLLPPSSLLMQCDVMESPRNSQLSATPRLAS